MLTHPAAVQEQQARLLLQYYSIKRQYVAIDEWCTYVMLVLLFIGWLYVCETGRSKTVRYSMLGLLLVFAAAGTWFLYTSYKNLGRIENQLPFAPAQYFLYPFQ